jgi:membrane protein YdbS with pleckstrin-like domain
MKEEFDKEMSAFEKDNVLDPAYMRKKLLVYAIRTAIAIGIIWYFWDREWMKWVLWIYVPLNLLGLATIFLTPYILKRKIQRTREKMDTLESDES